MTCLVVWRNAGFSEPVAAEREGLGGRKLGGVQRPAFGHDGQMLPVMSLVAVGVVSCLAEFYACELEPIWCMCVFVMSALGVSSGSVSTQVRASSFKSLRVS